MKVTVVELSHEAEQLERSWANMCAHTTREHSELVVLPELAFSAPVWIDDAFEPAAWAESETRHAQWLPRLAELGATWVVGTRPVTDGGNHFNEGYLWSAKTGSLRLRRKCFLPDEPEAWEARWFAPGDSEFPRYTAGALSFGVNICTELWALETFSQYRELHIDAVIAPRATAAATAAKWLALGTVAATASGAYCLSSNRVHRDGSCGGGGWIIDPDGQLLAQTSTREPFCTVELELARRREAELTYPRYVFRTKPRAGS